MWFVETRLNVPQVVKLLVVLTFILFMCQCEDSFGKGGAPDGKGVPPDGTGVKGGRDFGDLVICWRDADGVPVYLYTYDEEDKESGPYIYPIMFWVADGYPVTGTDDLPGEDDYDPANYEDVGDYVAFKVDVEGEVHLPVDDQGVVLADVKEANFGRMSLVRSPQSVLDSALDEAIVALTLSEAQIDAGDYITTDASGRLVVVHGLEDWSLENLDPYNPNPEDDDKTIDSPRENIAIYQELLNNGFGDKLDFLPDLLGNLTIGEMDLMIGAIAGAADKSGKMTVDTVAYMNNWLLDEDTDNLLDIDGEVTDDKGRKYYDYGGFSYSRSDVYDNKYVEITALDYNGGVPGLGTDGTFVTRIVSLYDALKDGVEIRRDPDSTTSPVIWQIDPLETDSDELVRWSTDNISDFAKAVDDAIQVLEFIHSSDLIVYSPYFVVPTTGP